MRPFRKCVVWRERGYSTFSGWLKEEQLAEETELEGPVRSEKSHRVCSIVKSSVRNVDT